MMTPRMLLVEDEIAIVKVTKARLAYEGFEVIVAMDGEEALRQVQASGPMDLALTDITLPKLDGCEATKRLKADPATASLPIRIYTASSARWERLTEQCVELGIAGWLRKPFRSRELLEAIRRVLGQEGAAHG